MRLIDADALFREMEKAQWYNNADRDEIAEELVLNAPTIEERKNGRWKKSYADHESFGVRPFFRYCSECHESTVYAYNYFPNCGARMEE